VELINARTGTDRPSPSTPSRCLAGCPWLVFGGVRTAMACRRWPGRPTSVLAVVTILPLGGRMRSTAAAMMFGAARLVALWFRRCIATLAEAAKVEQREGSTVPASGLRLLLLLFIFTQSARHLHLVAALLPNPFIAGESSTPHTEPAMDGRCLSAMTPSVFLL
jgi:hypothetical protein